MLFALPKIQLRGNSILMYWEPQYTNARSKQNCLKLSKNFKETKTYSGQLKTHTAKRLVKAISLLIQSTQRQRIFNPISQKKQYHHLSFITLTVPDAEPILTLKDAYSKLLKPFLTYLRDTEKVYSYIWKAERQKRGQIHYHITTPSWIHHQLVRNKWNYLLQIHNLYKNFISETGKNTPPSTQIKAVWKIRDLQAYLSKEFRKSIQNDHQCQGKIWDCSNNLKGKQYFTVYYEKQHEKLLHKANLKHKLSEKNLDTCIVFRAQKQMSWEVITADEKMKYADFLDSIRRPVNNIFTK